MVGVTWLQVFEADVDVGVAEHLRDNLGVLA
jgi:hypothetical protein